MASPRTRAARQAASSTRDLLYILGVRERTDKIVRELVLDDRARLRLS
jgi:hypothetical protein